MVPRWLAVVGLGEEWKLGGGEVGKTPPYFFGEMVQFGEGKYLRLQQNMDGNSVGGL